jgi:hypothetical protein
MEEAVNDAVTDGGDVKVGFSVDSAVAGANHNTAGAAPSTGLTYTSRRMGEIILECHRSFV